MLRYISRGKWSVLLGILLCGCPENPVSQELPEIQMREFNIVELPREERAWNSQTIIGMGYWVPVDSEGVRIFEYRDSTYYHPIQIAHRLFWYLDSYYQTGDEEYLRRATVHGERMLQISTMTDSARYFPFVWDYYLHYPRYKDEILYNPWVGGMSQGEALAAFVRLYWATGDTKYTIIADEIFRTFTRLKGETDEWIVNVDEDGYYWIEEHTLREGTHVLNGFVYAIYGLYDYYLLTKSEEAEYYLKAALSTMYQYIPAFRVEGEASIYCLEHEVQTPVYHIRDHLPQINMLYKMTGDEYFKELYDVFYEDYH